ncbi:hypothetical protein AB4Z54_36250 [Streptomyces sp. MCAF7]
MRIEAHQAWQDLVGQIRRRPGFGDSLRARTAARLARQAQDGAVVFVSTSSTRCDALILTAEADSPVRAVPLPGLTQGKAYDRADRLRAGSPGCRGSGDRSSAADHGRCEILDVLEWLWDVVAEPVLTRVGHTSCPAADEPWPRLWWCPVGIMAFLPLHAAGYHAEHRGAGRGRAGRRPRARSWTASSRRTRPRSAPWNTHAPAAPAR